MAKMKKWRLEREYVQVPNETAVAVELRESEPEECISLQALGLIVNLWSYNTEEWELHKTELYKRYGKNKEVSVKNAWKELMDANYIIEYKFRVGKKWDYEYYYRITPFTAEEREEILAFAEKEHGQIWGLDFQDLKMKTSKPRDNKYIINEKQINKKEDDDIPNVSLSDETINQNLNIELKEQQEIHIPKLSDDDLLWITDKVRDIFKGKIQKRSFDSVLKKCINNYKKGTVPNYENYLITAIENKIQELELRKEREKSLLDLVPKVKHNKKTVRKEIVPDWLNEQKEQEDTTATVEGTTNGQADKNLEEERKRLEEELKKYKRD
ncbi:hypothetical protein [Bacillus pseudomycoides]|uniref:hypothetical protein n=1 Tax=Bacillus pseudomycoides TaxID=64104 RepID=UPI000BF0FD5A|nr:hypothetical protein [Bacillus pseudomycoides]PEN09700.1 hypothetical protein CN640_11675 [Bacillus pseudomycoides]